MKEKLKELTKNLNWKTALITGIAVFIGFSVGQTGIALGIADHMTGDDLRAGYPYTIRSFFVYNNI